MKLLPTRGMRGQICREVSSRSRGTVVQGLTVVTVVQGKVPRAICSPNEELDLCVLHVSFKHQGMTTSHSKFRRFAAVETHHAFVMIS